MVEPTNASRKKSLHEVWGPKVTNTTWRMDSSKMGDFFISFGLVANHNG